MRCSRCGVQIGNSFARVNNMLLCDNCARELRIDEMIRRQSSIFDQAFPSLGDFSGVFSMGSDLDFANAKIRCPRCGMTLRDIEAAGQLGCIECYNTFNETIMKNILKRQGSSEYKGRKPGENADIKGEAVVTVETEEAKPAPAKIETDVLDRLKNADLGTVTDELLEEGMKKAAEAEDYQLAARLRDELMSRKGGNA